MKGHQLGIRQLLLAIVLTTLSACTSTQVNDGASRAAGQLFTIALDIATDSGKGETREYEPGKSTHCDLACEYREEARIDARYAEHERRERRAESEAFKAEFEAFMRQIEDAEQRSADPPASDGPTHSQQS